MGFTGRRAAVVALVAVAAMPAACGGGPGGREGDGARIAPADPAPTIAPPAPTDLRAAGATAIDIRGRWLTAGAGSVWLSGRTAIYRLDAATGERTATVPVRQRPCEGTAVGLGAVWTATCGTPGLARIDTARNRVSGHVALPVPRELGGEAEIATGAGSVWLVVDGRDCGACRVARVDARSLRVVARIPVMAGAAGVRVAAATVWVTNPDNDVVQRIDPRRDRVAGTLRTGDMPRFLTADRTGVWILNQADGTATHVDPRTGAVATTDIGMHGAGGGITAGARWIWARGSERMLTRVDPRTRQVIERYGPDVGSGSVVVGFGAVWVSAPRIGTLWRLPLNRVHATWRAT